MLLTNFGLHGCPGKGSQNEWVGNGNTNERLINLSPSNSLSWLFECKKSTEERTLGISRHARVGLQSSRCRSSNRTGWFRQGWARPMTDDLHETPCAEFYTRTHLSFQETQGSAWNEIRTGSKTFFTSRLTITYHRAIMTSSLYWGSWESGQKDSISKWILCQKPMH